MPAQLDLDGREHAALSDPPAPRAPVPLFHAPSGMRGQREALKTCTRCGRERPAMADRGEACCGWETQTVGN